MSFFTIVIEKYVLIIVPITSLSILRKLLCSTVEEYLKIAIFN